MSQPKAVIKTYREVKINGERMRCHRLLAEQALGKPLPPGSQVHHVDRDKWSFTPRLVICQDQAYHTFLHHRMRTQRAGGDPNTQKVCGTCKSLRMITDFKRNRSQYSGFASECLTCASARRKEWRHRKSAEIKFGRDLVAVEIACE